MISTSRLRTASVLALSLLLATGCNRNGDNGGKEANPSTASSAVGRFLLQDATSDDLLSFSVELSGVSVVYDDGTVSDNLLSVPFRLELLSLEDYAKWVAQAAFDVGTVESIQISFTPNGYVARARDGRLVTVDALSNTFVSPLAAEADVAKDELITFITDVDLLDSLQGDVSSGTITFDPEGVSSVIAPGQLVPVDRFIGRVERRNTGTLELSVEGFADDDRTAPIGRIPIFADAATLCLDRNLFFGFSSLAEFYTILYPGLTIVELHGFLQAGGEFIATRIEIEDQDGGAGATYPYKLRGTVVDTRPGVVRLSIQSIPRGAQFALPVLEGLGNPAATDISLSSQKLRVLLGNEVFLPTSVLVGDDIDVKFQAFPSQPFPAVVVGIRSVNPGYCGTISDTLGLPNSFEMNLDESDPAVQSGDVASSDTDVLVKLPVNLTEIVLGTVFTPFLEPGDLVTGLDLRVNGMLRGNPSTPLIDATGVLVRPALLDGAEVTAVDVMAQSFTVVGGDVQGDFGGAFQPSATYTVFVESQATFVGLAPGLVELADALALLGPAERLMVDVKGIGREAGEQIRGYQVRSFLQQ